MAGDVVGPDPRREQIGQPLRALIAIDHELTATGFEQKLAAPAAGHQELPVGRRHADRCQPPAPGGVQGGHKPAFGAEREAIRCVLDVAGGQQAAIGGQRRGAYAQPRIGRVGVAGRGCRRRPQPGPIDFHGHRHPLFLYGPFPCGPFPVAPSL